jgi:hypothetical protein
MSIIIKPNPSMLDWEVQTQKLYNQHGQSLRDYKMLVRSDSGALLNVCKKSYRPTLNAKFKETVEKMSKITGFEFNGYVEAYGGKRLFAYLKSENQKVAGFDFENYMVIGNSHDYSSGFFIATVHEMLRCQNQWSKLKKGSLHTIPHTSSSDERISELVLRFENYMEELNRNKRRLEIWKEIEISPVLREMMIERVLNIETGKEDSMPTRTQKRFDSLNLAMDRELRDVGNNLLGLFQGVTYYTTHLLNQKSKVFGNLIGNAYTVNERAKEFCESVVEGTLDNIELNIN